MNIFDCWKQFDSLKIKDRHKDDRIILYCKLMSFEKLLGKNGEFGGLWLKLKQMCQQHRVSTPKSVATRDVAHDVARTISCANVGDKWVEIHLQNEPVVILDQFVFYMFEALFNCDFI